MTPPEPLTVAVASCGRPGELARCLAALAAQTRPPEQVIVVDQEPSDAARRALADSDLGDALYLEQERLGLSASRNLALREARTALLAVTDDDCAPDPTWLEAATAALGRSPRPPAVTGPILPLGDPPPGAFAVSLRVSEDPVDYRGRAMPWGVGSGANLVARTRALTDLGGWDERLGAGSGGMAAEDADLIYRLLRAGETIRYEPAAVVRHAWQTRERRMQTRWSYGFGIGAMCGLWIARGERYAVRMLGGYLRLQLRPLVAAVLGRRRDDVEGRLRALAAVVPGLRYGLQVARSDGKDG